MFPANNTVDMSIDQTMQRLRDRDRVTFLGGGVYRWLGNLDDTDVTDEGADDTGGDDGDDAYNGGGDVADVAGEAAAELHTIANIVDDGSFVDAACLE